MNELNDHSTRAHALLSASSAHRWLKCPPSAVAAEAYPEQDTDYTKEGTLAHEVAEKMVSTVTSYSELLEIEGVTYEMIECAKAYAEYIQERIKSPDAVVLLEQKVDFSPWVPEGFGTCDCIIIQGDTLTIIDYKFGKGVAVSALGNDQLKLYALGALNDYGFAYDVKRAEMHIFQPRIDNTSDCQLLVEDLMEWAEKTVKPTAEKAAKGEGDFCTGDHCTFCPHAGRCRELDKVCTSFVEVHGVRAAVPVLTPWEIAEVLKMEGLISLWLRRVKAQALTDLMDGKQVPGFKVVEGKLGNRKWTDELKAAEALKAAGYNQEEITETKLLSPSQMDKAIGKKKVVELLDSFIDRAPGSPAVVPDTDKRPAYDRLAEAQKDFI
jgi:hypothetical protein